MSLGAALLTGLSSSFISDAQLLKAMNGRGGIMRIPGPPSTFAETGAPVTIVNAVCDALRPLDFEVFSIPLRRSDILKAFRRSGKA
jgi:hypothetical protein